MNFVEFATRVRDITETDTTTLPDAELLIKMNVNKDEICREISNRKENFFEREFETHLLAGVREYAFPLNVTKVVGVEVLLDGDRPRRGEEIDMNSYGNTSSFNRATTDEATIIERFSDDNPMYKLSNRMVVLYTGSTIPAQTDGLKMYGIEYPANFTQLTSTDSIAYDRSVVNAGFPLEFHDLLAIKCALDYGVRDPLKQHTFNYNNWRKTLDEVLKKIKSQNADRKTSPRVPAREDWRY